MTDPVVLKREGLDRMVEVLIGLGYRVVGPTVRDSAIILAELDSAARLSSGWGIETGAGTYRLRRRYDVAVFGHGEPVQLLDAWTGAKLAIVVDAVLCEHPQPGRIRRGTSSPTQSPATRDTS